MQICETLLAIYQGSEGAKAAVATNSQASEEVRNAPDEPQRVSTEYNRYMMEISGVAETLVKALTLLQSYAVTNVLFQVRTKEKKFITGTSFVSKTLSISAADLG